MTVDEFRSWLERRALTYYRAAPLLAADQTEVMRWAKGERRIGRRAARIMELLNEQERIRALAQQWLATAHEMMEPSGDAPAVQVADTLSECANELLELLAWPERRDLNHTQAAPLLAASQPEVTR
jgi:hypothetical protein